jgi:hypothetical protein
MSKRRSKLLILAATAALIAGVFPALSGKANAASTPEFASVIVRLDQLDATTGTSTQYTGGTVCVVTPGSWTGSGTENYVDVGFPTEEASGGGAVTAADDFQVDTTLSTWIATTTDPGSANTGSNYWPSGAVAWPNIGGTLTGGTATAATNTAYTTGQVATLKIVRFSTNGLAVSSTYCFNFKDGSGTTGSETGTTYSLQNPFLGANGYQEVVPGFVSTYHCTGVCTAPGDGSILMSSNWGTQILPNNSIVITAVVPPILELTFSANQDTFKTNLDPNTPVVTNGVNVVVKTNAKGGWMLWTRDTNNGELTSAASGGSIGPGVTWNGDAPTVLTGTGGGGAVPAYALDVATGTNGTGPTLCTAQPEPEYNGSLVAPFSGGLITNNWTEIADCSIATPPGTDSGTQVTLTELASINFSTPAASDYTDTLWVVGAGQF